MQQAAQTSAQDIGQFFNPYTESVTNQIAKLGARNLSENLLPAVSDSFIRAGQFGGTRMGEFGSRALRDTQESVLASWLRPSVVGSPARSCSTGSTGIDRWRTGHGTTTGHHGGRAGS
jgi:hypothetical protein